MVTSQHGQLYRYTLDVYTWPFHFAISSDETIEISRKVATPYNYNFNQSSIYEYVNLSNLYSWLGNG
jgi:hypothetical protein